MTDFEQLAALQQAQQDAKRSKYGNRKASADGYTFDSQAEYRRYRELRLMEAASIITDLEVHPKFSLTPGGRDKWSGQLIRARRYEGDFQYQENGHVIVEDVKGAMTQAFRLKWDIVRLRYPHIEFRMVKA